MTNDCWFDPNIVATALKKRRLCRHTANSVFEAMTALMRTDNALSRLQDVAPLTAARIEQLLGDADDVDLDRAVRIYAAFVAGVLFPYAAERSRP